MPWLSTGSAMFGVAANVQDAAVDLGMEGLDAAIEHLREPSQFGDVEDGEALFAEGAGGAAGRDKCHAKAREVTGEVDQSGLISDAEQGAADFLGIGRLETVQNVHRG